MRYSGSAVTLSGIWCFFAYSQTCEALVSAMSRLKTSLPRRALVVDAQHDVSRFGYGELEKLHEHVDDEVLGCVIIVVEHDHVAGCFF